MTTIAANREEIYGDLQYTNTGSGNKFKGGTKVLKFNAHDLICDVPFIVGFTGTPVDMIAIIDFFRRPENYKRPPRSSSMGLVLTAEKDLFIFEDPTKWLAVDQPFTAIGSGAAYAIGAMENGASAKEAVRAAMKHDAYTGFGVKGYSH